MKSLYIGPNGSFASKIWSPSAILVHVSVTNQSDCRLQDSEACGQIGVQKVIDTLCSVSEVSELDFH